MSCFNVGTGSAFDVGLSSGAIVGISVSGIVVLVLVITLTGVCIALLVYGYRNPNSKIGLCMIEVSQCVSQLKYFSVIQGELRDKGSLGWMILLMF